VVDRKQLPSEKLTKVEDQLWPQVEARLWEISRGFEIGQETEVALAIQQRIAAEKPKGYGLEIQQISVAITPDKSATNFHLAVLEVGRTRELDALKDGAEAEKKQRRRDLTGKELDFYGKVVKNGDAIVLKLIQHPDLVDQVMVRLAAQDREQFQRDLIKIQLLMEHSDRGEKGLFDDERRKLSQAILNSISSNFKTLSGLTDLLSAEQFGELPEPDDDIKMIGEPATHEEAGAQVDPDDDLDDADNMDGDEQVAGA
jgi:hypothetical protein